MIELLRKRRSIRRYTEQEVEEEKISLLTEAALLSPSSKGIKPCEIITVTDRNILKKLSEAKRHGSEFLKYAPLAIIVLADTSLSDAWIEDASIISIVIQLEAESLGLGSCWIQVRNRYHKEGVTAGRYIADILGIPERYSVESIIAAGYPDEHIEPHSKILLRYDKVHHEKY